MMIRFDVLQWVHSIRNTQYQYIDFNIDVVAVDDSRWVSVFPTLIMLNPERRTA